MNESNSPAAIAPAKYIALDDGLYEYVVRHRSHSLDPLLDELRVKTEALGEIARMLISREQGEFLTILTKLLQVGNAVEVGTFTGYSSVCIARALTNSGRLTCFDLNKEWTAIAQRYWARGNLAGRIELRLGNAAEELVKWKPAEAIDLAFIDADKPGYDRYFEILLPLLKPNGLFIFDNMLWGGRINQEPRTDADGIALHRLNEKLAHDPRVESVLLPIADGLHLARKK